MALHGGGGEHVDAPLLVEAHPAGLLLLRALELDERRVQHGGGGEALGLHGLLRRGEARRAVRSLLAQQRALQPAPRQRGLAHAAHRLAVQHALVVGGLVQPRRDLFANLHLSVAVALDEA
eukprot:scaffold32581_cov63-Phaeocystis_antarctica.AAC.1